MTAQPSPPSPIGRRLGKHSVGPSTFYKVWTQEEAAEEAEGQQWWKKNSRGSAGCLGLDQRNQTDVPMDNWATPTPLSFPERDEKKEIGSMSVRTRKCTNQVFGRLVFLPIK